MTHEEIRNQRHKQYEVMMQSDLREKDWYAINGVSYNTMQYWKKHFRTEQVTSSNHHQGQWITLIPGESFCLGEGLPSGDDPEATSNITLYCQGTRIDLNPGFDGDELKLVLKALMFHV